MHVGWSRNAPGKFSTQRQALISGSLPLLKAQTLLGSSAFSLFCIYKRDCCFFGHLSAASLELFKCSFCSSFPHFALSLVFDFHCDWTIPLRGYSRPLSITNRPCPIRSDHFGPVGLSLPEDNLTFPILKDRDLSTKPLSADLVDPLSLAWTWLVYLKTPLLTYRLPLPEDVDYPFPYFISYFVSLYLPSLECSSVFLLESYLAFL